MDRLDNPVQDTAPDVEGLKEAFNWLFNYSAAGIPSPASMAEYFWIELGPQENDNQWSGPYQIFKSLLAFAFFQFNPTNIANPHLDAQNRTAGLPPDFYTTASIGNPYERIVVNRTEVPQPGYDPADDVTTAEGNRSIRKLLKGRRTVVYKIRKT
ncbi:hypothetical protein LTR55_011941 [Exophiala xenobiotica]|nr:hypothetical protein LTR14_012032 [Exophiala xenobiotica]KAK5460316.1 hypothetical protein LTR55_011941 [Exophiala xenobiotica]